MYILSRMFELRDERKWSNYELAKEANIPQSTLTNLLKHNNLPTIPTLISMCNAFEITLMQFFNDKNVSFLTSASPWQKFFWECTSKDNLRQ